MVLTEWYLQRGSGRDEIKQYSHYVIFRMRLDGFSLLIPIGMEFHEEIEQAFINSVHNKLICYFSQAFCFHPVEDHGRMQDSPRCYIEVYIFSLTSSCSK